MTTLKQKLSSRKFWIGLILVIVGIVLCCLGNTKDGLTIISIGAISYLGAEGLVDIFRIVFSSGLMNPTEVVDGIIVEDSDVIESNEEKGTE